MSYDATEMNRSASPITLDMNRDEAHIVLAIVGKHCFDTGLLSAEDMQRFADAYGNLKPADRDMFNEVRGVMWRLLEACK